MITNSEIQKKVINKNTILYTNVEKSIHLELTEKPTSERILWYQSLRCHLLATENKMTASTDDNETTMSTLQVPALLLKKIGLLNNVNLVDDNQNLVTIETFFASDINAVLQGPNIQSIDGIYNSAFQTLFPKSEGWISKKIVPYLKNLYELIYNELDKDYHSALIEKNPLSTIRAINNERYKKYKEHLKRENQIKKQKSKLRKPHLNDSPDLTDALLQPKSNYESYDIESYVGSIIAVLILLKKYHLQYLETQIQEKKSDINNLLPPLDECIYNAEKAKQGKISIQKILDAYLHNNTKHTNLGEQFHAILLFNNAITPTQEFSTILLLARIETSFITPLDIIKSFIFFNKDSWATPPIQQSRLSLGPSGNAHMNFGQLAFTQNWIWNNFIFWSPRAAPTSYPEYMYSPGDWSELIEDTYIDKLYPLMTPDNIRESNTDFIESRFKSLTDYLTILSIYPYEYGLEQMPDITKSFRKRDEKNPFWLLHNRFSTVVAKLELKRAYQNELNYIDTAKQLHPLIDGSLLEFTRLLKERSISTEYRDIYINLTDFTCDNNRKLARYITNKTDDTTIKYFLNFLNLHKRHINYYIIDIINDKRTYAPSNNKSLQFKQAYLISLKLLYSIYQLLPRKFTSANEDNLNDENLNKKIYKSVLFPSLNSSTQENSLMKALKDFLFEPIITTIIVSREPQHYFYKLFERKLEQYKDFVDYLYESSLISIDNNLIRKF